MEWCYCSAGELHFGEQHITSMAGVQQGAPLGLLLCSLVILDILDDIGHIDGLHLQLWYLDDGTFMGITDGVCMIN